MIRKPHLRNLKRVNIDGAGTKDKIQFLFRGLRWKCRKPFFVWIEEIKIPDKGVQFQVTGEGVEIPGNDHRFRVDGNDFFDVIQLLSSGISLQSQMEQKETDPADMEFHNKTFEPEGHVVMPDLLRWFFGEEGVCLSPEDRYFSSDRGCTVFHGAV